MTVEVGGKAPYFELPGEFDPETRGFRPYRLSEALKEGPVLLHFFPAPFTFVCQAQMCAVRDSIEDYRAEGIAVWGVTGHYPMINAAWAKEHDFGVPLLADYEHTMSEQYVGTYSPDQILGLKHLAKRAVVSIAQDGTVAFVWITEDPGVAPSEEVIKQAIGAAKGKRSAAA
jgi:glutaredoxin-dependent peroxiredoxin